MKPYPLSIRPYGLRAVLVEWPSTVDEAILEDILCFYRYLKTKCLKDTGWEMIPAYNSLTLVQNYKLVDFKNFSAKLKKWYAEKSGTIPEQRYLWRLPVCYDLDFGIDLELASEKLRLSVPEIIEQHTAHVYRVYGIGFLPGFMYLGGLPESLEITRKETPRLKVAKGAVGLAGKQTGIYPQESPGGWNIIGNCPVSIFNAKEDHPCLVSVGDQIQFYSISRAEYDLHKIEGEVGIYKIEKLKIDA
ncbi:5-oxoprolinase subunit PxpB [Maribacter algicola]|uniref:5-oxoprolinase subunit PxpB n=1 Tax=Meishania litoralis TaxID=3434685 RepID=A0ACC7LR19_9FLAO